MKLLCMGVLALASGCVIESSNNDVFCGDGVLDVGEGCDDGNNVSGDGCSAVCATESADTALITANWSIQNVDGQTTACPTGFDTAAVYSQPVDANFQPVGQPIIDLFDCVDSTGVTAPLPPDVYQVWIEITNANNTQVYAKSLSAIVDVTAADKTFSASILNDGGYFMLTWDLVDAANGNAPLTCAQVAGLDGVEAISTSVADATNAVTDQFTCDDHFGITGGLLQGTYTVSVDAFSDTAGALGTAPTLTNKVIGAQNQVTDLGNVIIPID